MKKIIMLLFVGVLSFSLTACGGSSNKPASVPEAAPASTVPAPAPEPPKPVEAPKPAEPPKPVEAPKEPEMSPEEKARQEILSLVDFAYTGYTSANVPMYFLSGSGEEYVALMIVDANGKEYIKFDGSAEIDEDTGILTITDRDKGYKFGFTVEEQEDGTFFLDCGNLGNAYLEEDDPEYVVDIMISALLNMKDETDALMEAVSKTNFMDSLESAYTGLTDAGAPMFFLVGSNGQYAALVLLSTNGEEYISFVGSLYYNEDTGIVTIKDTEKGYNFGFIAEAQEDGSFFLNCGNLGQCYLELDAIETVVDYIDTAFTEMDDATDAFMAEISASN